MTGDSECVIGLPSTAARRLIMSEDAVLLGLLDVVVVLGVRGREGGVALLVDGHEEDPGTFGRGHRALYGVLAGVVDRTDGQPRFVVRVVGVVGVVQLGLGEVLGLLRVLALRPQPVVDRDVHLQAGARERAAERAVDRKSTRLNSSHPSISYAVF